MNVSKSSTGLSCAAEFSFSDSIQCTVVVPTFCEADNLHPLCRRIFAALSDAGLSHEILIVDDDSGDGSEEIIEEMRAQGAPVRIIVRKDVRGLSSAVIHGFREARGKILVCMDADLSHPPEKLPDLISSVCNDNADFAIGSRYAPGGTTEQGWGIFRMLNSKVATLFARPFTRALDPMSGFFALSREQFMSADALNPVGYKIGLELLVKCRCRRVSEVPIHFANRERGESKLTLMEQWRYVKHIKRLADYKYGWLSHLIQFSLTGLTGLAVDLSVFSLMLRMTSNLTYSIYFSRAIAIFSAMTWNFWLNRRMTFSYSRSSSPLKQYFRFTASSSFGAILSWSVAVGLIKFVPAFSRHLFLAATVGIVAGAVSNFLLSFKWAFGKEDKRLS